MQRFVEAQLRGDRREALRLILEDGIGRGLPATTLQLEVIQPAQRRIGELWACNEIGIAEEHVATVIANLVLTALYAHLPRREANGHHVVVACVEGELHDLGARISADFLEAAGFDVTLAGANVPTHELVNLVRVKRAGLVALSATMTFHIPALRRAVAELRAAFGRSFPVAIGGRACDVSPELVAELGATVYGTSAEALVEGALRALTVAA
jgi:methanogenic corrinoid protein MtbC1